MFGRFCSLLTVVLLVAVPAASHAGDLPRWLKSGKKDSLSDDKVIAGLKETLHVGTENAVSLTGRPGGYFDNEAIKILMPDKLRKLDKGLRAIGLGPQLDEFVLSMNRAAESAAPFAKEIIWDAVKQMSFDDAKKILKGGDTAATDYFRSKTADDLTEVFTPIVHDQMNEVGVTQQYEQLIGRYDSIPFAKSPKLDLDQYVVAEALDGLFFVLADEERKIRKNPAARVTDILKEVFGNDNR